MVKYCTRLIAATLLFSALSPASAQSWSQPHGNATADGFIDVRTAPASRPATSATGLGKFAPGVGPVVGSNGIAVFGTLGGRVMGYGNIAQQKWALDLPGKSVLASAVIGANDSAYVVGVMKARDHRDGADGREIGQMTLNKIDKLGRLVWSVNFPEQFNDGHSVGSGISSAPPVLGTYDGREVVFVTVHLPGKGKHVQLVAFDDTGGLMTNLMVLQTNREFGDPWYCWFGFCKPEWPAMNSSRSDPAARLPRPLQPPMPGAALTRFGGEDWVVVSDGLHTVVGYTYTLAGGPVEKFRRKDADHPLTSGASIMPDGRSMFGLRKGRVGFGGPSPDQLSDFNQWENISISSNLVLVPPSRTAAGLVVVTGKDFGLTVVDNATVTTHVELPADTISGVTVSRNHVFVSTVNQLLTYDATNFTQLASFAWTGGGQSTPAIASDGRMFALAGGTLYVFAPPTTNLCKGSDCKKPDKSKPPTSSKVD